MVQWGIELSFRENWLGLFLFFLHPFYLESACLSGIVQEVLGFVKNLNNLLIYRWFHLPLLKFSRIWDHVAAFKKNYWNMKQI